MSHTEDLVKQASEASLKALEDDYKKSQELTARRTWMQEACTFLNTHIFHRIGLHIIRPDVINDLIKNMVWPMREFSCSGSFESFLHKPKEWDEVYGMLSDDYSKDIFDWFVKYRTTITLTSSNIANQLYPFKLSEFVINPLNIKKHIGHDNFTIGKIKTNNIVKEVLTDTFDYNQYRYQDIVEASNKDTVIDAGGYRGDTALYFSAKIGPEGNIYVFEPSDLNYKYLNQNIHINHLTNIVSVKAGVGYISASAKQTGEGGGVSLVTIDNSNQKANSVRVYSIDDFIKENKIPRIDFIKMDIEGWELDALRGAENCLGSYKPKLAICVYHKPEDLLDIVNYLKLIVPEYRFYLDHKSLDWTETVLYAKV